MKTKLISVIMPAYNAEEYIRQAIESVLGQTYENLELLIADDGSTDTTLSVINEFKDPRIKTFHNERNLGYLETCNQLLDKCKGQYISFQDADDWSEKNRFELLIDGFNSHPQLGLFGSGSRYFEDATNETFRWRRPETNPHEIKSILKTHSPFNGATICIRRDVYEKTGGYRSFFNRIGSEDYDWLCRIADDYEVGAIPEVLYHVRINPNSITKNIHSPMQLIGVEVVKACTKQRQSGEIDYLDDPKRKDELENFILKEMKPYDEDSSLLIRKQTESAYYYKLYKKALHSAIAAVWKNPLKLINYRAVFYVIRKANVKIFHSKH